MSDNLIAGFLKIRNGLLRGDLYRVILNMEKYCSEIFVCADASFDGTDEWLINYLGDDHVIRVPAAEHDFANELEHKQALLGLIHRTGTWGYIYWADSDEVLDAKGTAELRQWCQDHLDKPEIKGLTFHYVQLWQSTNWARIDNDFDNGHFLKLWKYEPTLKFEVQPGTHHRQFPIQFDEYLRQGKIRPAPWEVLHYGNVGEDLKWKVLQYYGGLGGVDRHLHFEHASYRPVDPATLPPDVEVLPSEKPPEPFTPRQIALLEQMQNLTHLKETFCIIVPTYNRADYLKRTLDSVLAQTYEKWICVVLDDGGSDSTPYLMQEYLEKDPRFFFCRYLEHKGGVAVNEIGFNIALNTAEFWIRLGSDDWLSPTKLANDFKAFQEHPETGAVYGPFQVHRSGVFGELCNTPIPGAEAYHILSTPGAFMAGWANVAVRCTVLQQVKEFFGGFLDPRLVNMDDVQSNFRISCLTEWHWRGWHEGRFYVNPSGDLCRAITDQRQTLEAEAWWNENQQGASASASIYAKDRALTDQVIQEDRRKWESRKK